MDLSKNQRAVMGVLDNRNMTVNHITIELGYPWTGGQVRSILARLMNREIVERDQPYSLNKEYRYHITNYAYGVWREQFIDQPVLNEGTVSSKSGS